MFRALLCCSFVAVAALASAAPVPEAVDVSLGGLSAGNKVLLHKGGAIFLELPRSVHEAECARFRQVPGIADPKGVSFESVNRPGHYLRHANGRVYLNRLNNEGDRRDATFFVVKPLAGRDGWVSFETITHPGHFLVNQNDGVWIAKPSGDDFAVRAATFRLGAPVPTEKLAEGEARMRALTRQMMDLEAVARARLLQQEGVRVPRRPAANVVYNVENFDPVSVRFVRFIVLATVDGREPCLDELEVYGPDGKDNLALVKGAKATASSLLVPHPEHQIEFLNDGRHGHWRSWISSEPGKGWAQIELPAETKVSRVVWGRDGDGPGGIFDRLPTAYRVEVSRDGEFWKAVATGEDRSQPGKERWLAPPRVLAALDADQQAAYREMEAELKRLREARTKE